MAEADGLVEVDGVGKPSVAPEKERRGSDNAGLCDGMEEEATAKATTTKRRRDGHLRKLIDSLA